MNSKSKPTISAPMPSSNVPEQKTCYRTTSLGEALTMSLNELKNQGKLTDDVITKVFTKFDGLTAGFLSRSTPRLSFKSQNVERYKQFRGVQHFLFENVQIDVTSSARGSKDNFNINIPKLALHATPSSATRKCGNATTTRPPNASHKVGRKLAQENENATGDDEEDYDENSD